MLECFRTVEPSRNFIKDLVIVNGTSFTNTYPLPRKCNLLILLAMNPFATQDTLRKQPILPALDISLPFSIRTSTNFDEPVEPEDKTTDIAISGLLICVFLLSVISAQAVQSPSRVGRLHHHDLVGPRLAVYSKIKGDIFF